MVRRWAWVAAAGLLGACNEAPRPVASAASEAVPPAHYAGTGVLLGGRGCPGTIGVPFQVTLTLADGTARIPLGQRALEGRVGPNGDLAALRWVGDRDVTREDSRGRVDAERFVLDYAFDWQSRGMQGCAFRYEGRRAG
jgi:hypothetical protein